MKIDSKRIYTLASTQTSNGDKTITGCTAGMPLIFCHEVTTANKNNWCGLRVKSGARGCNGYRYTLGTDSNNADDSDGYSGSITVIPTGSSVVITLTDMAGDSVNNRVLVYKQ